VPRYTL
jgi:hypothetical protein